MTRAIGSRKAQEVTYPTIRRGRDAFELPLLDIDSPVQSWLRPAYIRLVDGWLVADWPEDFDASSEIRTKPGPGLLERFLKLRNAKDERILDYARRWGLLFGRPGEREPVELWRQWATEADATLRMADALHRGDEIDDDLRRALANAHRATGGTFIKRIEEWPLARDRADSTMLTREMNYWFMRGRVVPVFSWAPYNVHGDSGDPELGLQASSLFGALAVALGGAVARTPARLGKRCAGCDEYFKPTRTSQKYCGSQECNNRRLAKNSAAYRASHDASQTVRKVPDMPGRSNRKRPA